MNPRDGSPIDNVDYSHFLGTPIREWLDVKMLADEEGISIRGVVEQYRLLKSGERHRARLKPVVSLGMIWEAENELRLKIDRELIDASLLPGPIEHKFEVKVRPSMAELILRPELEQLRARESLLEERVASLERRLANMTWVRAVV